MEAADTSRLGSLPAKDRNHNFSILLEVQIFPCEFVIQNLLAMNQAIFVFQVL
jgi:hypothetical protein